ncbi:MAG: hypothetical protein JXR91_05790 [Deltaproteobacteria bacterium]|nr:hypothetical protein [Deltaproteobacteria bacterium]
MRFQLLIILLIISIIQTGCDSFIFEAVTPADSDFQSDGDKSSDSLNDSENIDSDWEIIPPFTIPDSIDECSDLNIDMGTAGIKRYTLGDGDSSLCTEENLHSIVSMVNDAGRGIIDFDCGEGQFTIPLLRPLKIISDVYVVFDGGSKITLDGRLTSRLIESSYDVTLIVKNMRFTRGLATERNNGGAIFYGDGGSSGSLQIFGSIFENNLSEQGRGGAVFAEEVQSIKISRSIFKNNYAGYGGAIFVWGHHLIIGDSIFEGNEVFKEGGALNFDGFSIVTDTDKLTICGSVFKNNSSIFNGSAIKSFVYNSNLAEYKYCSFTNNRASADGTWGTSYGALYHHGTKLLVDSVSFINNITNSDAAALFVDVTGSTVVINSTFSDNVSTGSNSVGGTLFFTKAGKGTLKNSTFVNNKALYGVIYKEDGALTIDNSIFSLNTGYADPDLHVNCESEYEGSNNIQWNDGDMTDDILCTKDILTLDPGLLNIQNNGGFVDTCAIDSDSPAVDFGLDCPRLDARAYSRPSTCDAGAFSTGATKSY